MIEIVSKRTENSKTYSIGAGKYRAVIGGICHYKDNYADTKELWKEIDLTPDENGNITKAPYTAIRSNGAIVFTDKKTGDSVTIKPTKIGVNNATLADVVVVASPEGIRLQRIIKNADGALTAEYDISVNGSSINVKADAVDADGLKVPINHSIENGKMLEELPELKAIDTDGTKKDIKYNVKVDPTLTVQPSSKDNQIHDVYPTANHGSLTWLQVNDCSANKIRSIIEFDISGVPSGVTANSATLYLYYYGYADGNPVGLTVTCSRILRNDWVESESTWNIYKSGNNWTTAGCGSDGNDYTSTHQASDTVPSSAGWMDWNVLDQLDDIFGVNSVLGFLLKDSDENGSSNHRVQYYSREYTDDTDLRPKLVIEYTTAGWSNILIINSASSSLFSKINTASTASISKINSQSV